jgi:hypothetical protein
MPMVSELREVIGAPQSEAEFEAAVSELGAAGIDRARISFLAQEELQSPTRTPSAATCRSCGVRVRRFALVLTDAFVAAA